MVVCLVLGFGTGNFGICFLGIFAMLLMGMYITAEGVDLEAGIMEDPVGSHNFVTTYDTHTVENDQVINLLGMTLIYLPVVLFLLSTYLAFGRR